MGISGRNRNQEFSERIRKRYEMDTAAVYWGSLVYYIMKTQGPEINLQKNLSRVIENIFHQKVRLYEQKYYKIINPFQNSAPLADKTVTRLERRRLIKTIGNIYSQPGEKKQLVYLLSKLGVVTEGQREWRENIRRIKNYEEELTFLKKQLRLQEESIVKLKRTEMEPKLLANLKREVINNIKQEIRLERLRYGIDG